MPYGDKDVLSRKVMGGGTLNEVHKVQYNRNIGTSGTGEGFFKPDKQAATETGSTNSQRAVASYRLAQALGLGDVHAEEDFATHGKQQGSVSAKADGQALQTPIFTPVTKTVAKGSDQTKIRKLKNRSNPLQLWKSKHTYEKMTDAKQRDPGYDNPVTQRGMLDLQALDSVTGQRDRHNGNIYVDDASGRVKGIDNDLAFRQGAMFQDISASKKPDRLKMLTDEREEAHIGLPPMMHSATADSIEKFNFKKKNLRTVLGDGSGESMLGDDELGYIKKRGRAMQSHVADLRKDGRVVDQFDAGTYDQLKAGHKVDAIWGDKRADNYIARNEEHLAAQRAQGMDIPVPARTAPPAVPSRTGRPALSGAPAQGLVPAPRTGSGTVSPAVARARRHGFSYG